MDPLAALLILLALGLVLGAILWPLRAGHIESSASAEEAQIADLEAAKEAKYLEIREAEMDFRTGKLSEADWRIIDRQLRAEAVEVLRRLDAIGASETDTAAPEALPSPEPCSRPSSPSSRSGSASS